MNNNTVLYTCYIDDYIVYYIVQGCYTVYYIVHYIQLCCAGARLLRWPLARLIPLLPLLATHHSRCPARVQQQFARACFNFQWPAAPPASAAAAAAARATPAAGAPSAKGSSKLSTLMKGRFSSMPTPSVTLPVDLRARFLVALNSAYQASSALKRCPLHCLLLGWFRNATSLP